MFQVADHYEIILRIEIRDPEANSSRTCLLTIADVWKICQIDMHDSYELWYSTTWHFSAVLCQPIAPISRPLFLD